MLSHKVSEPWVVPGGIGHGCWADSGPGVSQGNAAVRLLRGGFQMALRTSRLFVCCALGLGQGPMASQCGRAEQKQQGGEQDGPIGERNQYPVILVGLATGD